MIYCDAPVTGVRTTAGFANAAMPCSIPSHLFHSPNLHHITRFVQVASKISSALLASGAVHVKPIKNRASNRRNDPALSDLRLTSTVLVGKLCTNRQK